jgi:hypothetical protein
MDVAMIGGEDRLGEILVTTAFCRLAKYGFDRPEEIRPDLVSVLMIHGKLGRMPSHADIVQQQLIVARQSNRVGELREQTKPSIWARAINQEAVDRARVDLETAWLGRYGRRVQPWEIKKWLPRLWGRA